jgi:hypothetical protein
MRVNSYFNIKKIKIIRNMIVILITGDKLSNRYIKPLTTHTHLISLEIIDFSIIE